MAIPVNRLSDAFDTDPVADEVGITLFQNQIQGWQSHADEPASLDQITYGID